MSTTDAPDTDIETVVDATPEPAPTDESGRPLPYLTKVPGGVPDIDGVLREVADQTGGRFLLRIQPELYFPERRGVKYVWTRWGHVRWHIALTEDQALALKDDLTTFCHEWVRKQQGLAGSGA